MRTTSILRASALAVALGVTLAPSLLATTPLVVPGSAGWISTSITVQAGTSIQANTMGYVLTAKIPYYHIPGVAKSASGPDGQTWDRTCGEAYASFDQELRDLVGPCALDEAHFGTLLGRVGQTVFVIGDTTAITPPASGMLWLGVNDFENTYDDNHGAFTVLFK